MSPAAKRARVSAGGNLELVVAPPVVGQGVLPPTSNEAVVDALCNNKMVNAVPPTRLSTVTAMNTATICTARTYNSMTLPML